MPKIYACVYGVCVFCKCACGSRGSWRLSLVLFFLLGFMSHLWRWRRRIGLDSWEAAWCEYGGRGEGRDQFPEFIRLETQQMAAMMKREGSDWLLQRRMATQLDLMKNATVRWEIRHSILNNRSRGPDVCPLKVDKKLTPKCARLSTLLDAFGFLTATYLVSLGCTWEPWLQYIVRTRLRKLFNINACHAVQNCIFILHEGSFLLYSWLCMYVVTGSSHSLPLYLNHASIQTEETRAVSGKGL